MTYVWFLLIILRFDAGTHREPVSITGDNSYTTEEDCAHVGNDLVNWLNQDGVKPEWHCIPQLQQAEVPHDGDRISRLGNP